MQKMAPKVSVMGQAVCGFEVNQEIPSTKNGYSEEAC